jgi:hypothetical protein
MLSQSATEERRNRLARQVLLYRLPERNYSIPSLRALIGSNLSLDAKGAGQIKLAVHVGVQELDRII